MFLDRENRNIDGGKTSFSALNKRSIAFSATRAQASYENLSDRFICMNRNFRNQYFHTYVSRLSSMKDAVTKSCLAKWGDEVPVKKLDDLTPEYKEKCILIGFLYKCQKLKPNPLIEMELELELDLVKPQPKPTNFVSANDVLFLEDEDQRIRLFGNFDINELVSGVVIGVMGCVHKYETFEVLEYTFAEMIVNIEKVIDYVGDRYILLVSGLYYGDQPNLCTQLLADWVSGELGCPDDQENQSKICRVIIAGNAIECSHRYVDFKDFKFTEIAELETLLFDETLNKLVSKMKLLDKFLLDLVKSVHVDIMPGHTDPANHLLPQQPFHESVYAECSQNESLNRVPNPYECIIEGRRVLGSSGQPINKIKSVTDITDNLTILENTLKWSHIAPTAPDTLGCYPYNSKDPFFIINQPDIYFAGNMSSFGTKVVYFNGRPIRLVCVPAFAETQTCALINLRTLECRPLQFKLFEGFDSI